MRRTLSLLIGLCGLLMLAVGPVHAQPSHLEPSYFAVEGVGADDVLNIRAEPNAAAAIVGSFAHDAAPIEVLALEGGWVYVSTGEGMGWASAAYLREISLPAFAGSALPDGLVCSGTEPFWGMTLSGAGISFAGMDIAEARFDLAVVDGFTGVGPSKNFVIGEGGGVSLGLMFAVAGVGTGIGPIVARRYTGDRNRDLRWAIALGYVIGGVGLALTAPLWNFNSVLAGTALRGIDLQLFESEFIVLLGHSGSGKSTLVDAICCVDIFNGIAN